MRIRIALWMMLGVMLLVSACGGAAATEQSAPTEVPATNTAPPVVDSVATEEAVTTEEAITTEVAVETDATSEVIQPGVTIARVSFPQSSARQGPGTNYGPVAQVSVNQEYPVIAQAGEGTNIWYLVDLGEGQLAWLWARVVTIVPEGAVVEVAATIPAP